MTTNLRNWKATGVIEVHDGIAYRQMVETGTRDYHEQWVAMSREERDSWMLGSPAPAGRFFND